MSQNILQELIEETQVVLTGRGKYIDTILPPLLFVLINSWLGLDFAIWGALLFVFGLGLFRLIRQETWTYALGGISGVVLAIIFVRVLGKAEGFFLPNILIGGGAAVVTVLSIFIKRPMVAWSSFIARRWPWNWYWHPRVRPAYSEVTWIWGLFFAVRFLFQMNLFRDGNTALLAIQNVLLGWPSTVVLLALSYIYGSWRLKNLGGPSVDEFISNTQPPWRSQQRGF